MSVVNKMLQDLEARQTAPDEKNTDYEPPVKKQSKNLILIVLVVAIVAIVTVFIVVPHDSLFKTDNAGQSVDVEPVQVQTPVTAKKMVTTEHKNSIPETKITQLEQQSAENLQSEIQVKAQILKAVSSEKTEQALVQQVITKTNESQKPTIIEPQTETGFTMTGSSQISQTASLKQRIGDSLEANNLALASQLLEQLLEQEPENLKVRKRLASTFFAQGNYQQSKILLLQGITRHPDQADLKLMLARLYVAQKEPKMALDVLTGFEPNQQNRNEYLAYRAALGQQLKEVNIARKDYQTLTQVDQNNAKWWLGLAIAEDQLGLGNRALNAYKQTQKVGKLDQPVSEFIQQRIFVLTEGQ
jgi:MSHA biogenesis protein MshN